MKRTDAELCWQELFDRKPEAAIRPGLERIKRAWDLLGYEGMPAKVILIAGTNGKGSTSGMLWHLLTIAGYNAGLFSSPHLCYFRERFQLSQTQVNDQMIAGALASVRSGLPSELFTRLSFFELSTLSALSLFCQHKCEVVVLETGLGGRLDACNVVNPILTGITSVDLDHQALLGDSLQKIAREKLGIARPGIPLFWNEKYGQQKGLEPILRQTIAEKKIPLMQFGRDFSCSERMVQIKKNDPAKGYLITRFPLPAFFRKAPDILRHNYGMAFAMFCQHLEDYPPHEGGPATAELPARIHKDFAAEKYPWPPSLWGRFQKIRIKTHLNGADLTISGFLDVAHNPASVRQFACSLAKRTSDKPWPPLLLVSVLSDKDINGILDILSETGDRVLLFRTASERSFRAEQLVTSHRAFKVFDQFADAWEYAKKSWLPRSCCFAVCGSFLAVGEVLHYFSIYSQISKASAVAEGRDPHC